MTDAKSLTLDSKVARLPDLIFTEVDNDLVILSIANSKYYGAESVGRRIWQLIEQPITVTEICDALLNEFDTDRASCERDVLTFLDQLLTEKLIDVQSPETDSASP